MTQKECYLSCQENYHHMIQSPISIPRKRGVMLYRKDESNGSWRWMEASEGKNTYPVKKEDMPPIPGGDTVNIIWIYEEVTNR